MTRHIVSMVGLVLICLGVYVNALNGTFHYDDFHSIVENKAIRSLVNAPQFFIDPAAFSGDPDKAMYRPLVLLSYAFNQTLALDSTYGFIAVNLLIHMACSVLVCYLALLLLKVPEQALVAGVLFAVHPLVSEPVNYISARSESLAAFFYLTAFMAHIRAVDNRRWHGLGWGAFVLGLLCKSIVITLVLNLWLYDRWKKRQTISLWSYLPYCLMGLGYVILIWKNDFLSRSLEHSVRAWDMQLLTQLKAIVYYLKLLFFPWGLNVEHQFIDASAGLTAAIGAALIVSLSLLWLGWTRFRTMGGFVLSWSLTVLLPTLVMPLNMLVNERRLYLVVAALAWFTASLYTSKLRMVLGVLIVVLATLTVGRNSVWNNDASLWLDAQRKAPLMPRVHTNLGKALQLTGQTDAALVAYAKAINLEPRSGEAYNNIATIYHLADKSDEAIKWYKQALVYYPEHAGIRQNLADAYYSQGAFELAIEWYRKALEIDAENGLIWNNYGQTLYAAERYKEAESAFLTAGEIIPAQAESYNNLGNVYSQYRTYPAAIAMYKKALEYKLEEPASIWANLADAYMKSGAKVQAQHAIMQALKLQPENSYFLLLAGRIQHRDGAFDKAMHYLLSTVQQDSANAKAWVEMAEIKVKQEERQTALNYFVQAICIDSTYSRVWYGLAHLREDLGDADGALEAYRHFASIWAKEDKRGLEVQRKIQALELER